MSDLNEVHPFALEPPFTVDEIANARMWYQAVTPNTRLKRTEHDRCPHTPMCENVAQCLEYLAWYFRHRDVVDAKEYEIARRHGARI